MHKILIKIIFIGLLCLSKVVFADASINYFGIDYKYRWMKGHNCDTYAMQPVLPSVYQGGEIYFAHRFESNVGFDIGYEQSQNESQTYYFAANESFLGVTQQAGNYTVFQNRIRAFQFDLLGFITFIQKLEAIGQLGFLLMQADMHATAYSSGVAVNLNPSHNYNFIPRAGFGLQYFLLENIGVRGLVTWEGTGGMFRLKITDEDGIRRTIGPFRQSWCFAVGLVAKFK